MIDTNKLAFKLENIILKHKQCVVKSRSECDTSIEIAGKRAVVPCFPSNMKAIVNLDICRQFDEAGWFHVFPRVDEDKIFDYIIQANKEDWNFISISIGIKDFYFELLRRVKETKLRLDSIEIDLALGYTNEILPMVRFIRENFGDIQIIAGNGDSEQFIAFLAKNDVTVAKLNLGVSSSCRTKAFVGFSSSTITDLDRCAYQARNCTRPNGQRVKLLSDGGLTVKGSDVWIGDIAKIIRFGGDYIQSGALFSRCIDSPAIIEGYFGNASFRAKQHKNHIEGTSLKVETNGLTIKEMMKLVEDSLKSSISYAGGEILEDIRGVDYQIVF